MITLTYTKLRQVIALAATNPGIQKLFSGALSGESVKIDETQILDLLIDSNVDTEIITILTDKDPSTMDAIEGMQAVADFFSYFRANKPRLASWLKSIGFQVEKPKQPKKKA